MTGKTSYQSYTDETPFTQYREDFIHREAMCRALAPRHPELLSIANEAHAILTAIDAKRTRLLTAEDDQVRARAVEEASKLFLLDLYAETRAVLISKEDDALIILPEPPSTLKGMGITTMGQRVQKAVENLSLLPDDSPVKTAFLAGLQSELETYNAADKAEDTTRALLQGFGLAIKLYKSELSQAREAQLGAVQNILRDREQTAAFALPWRKPRRDPPANPPPAPPAAPT